MGKTRKNDNKKIVDKIKSGSHSLNPGIQNRFITRIQIVNFIFIFKIVSMEKEEIICVLKRLLIA